MEALSAYTSLSLPQMQEHPSWMITAFDVSGRIIFWNARSEEYFGIPRGQALGKTLKEILPTESTDERAHHLRRALRGQHTIVFHQQLLRNKRLYDLHFVPIRDP